MNKDFLLNSLLTSCMVSFTVACQAQQVGAKPVLTPAVTASSTPAPPPASPVAAGPLTVGPNYVIGAGDSLDIKVHEIPEQTGVVPVRPDGKISLPMIDDVQAAGYTPMQLGADITARLTKYYLHPIVTVSVVAVNSKRVFMVGEVAHTGPMDITPGMTILQAIATAGLTPYSKSSRIYIWRGDPMHQQKIKFDYKRAVKKGDMQGVTLIPGDTIVVP